MSANKISEQVAASGTPHKEELEVSRTSIIVATGGPKVELPAATLVDNRVGIAVGSLALDDSVGVRARLSVWEGQLGITKQGEQDKRYYNGEELKAIAKLGSWAPAFAFLAPILSWSAALKVDGSDCPSPSLRPPHGDIKGCEGLGSRRTTILTGMGGVSGSGRAIQQCLLRFTPIGQNTAFLFYVVLPFATINVNILAGDTIPEPEEGFAPRSGRPNGAVSCFTIVAYYPPCIMMVAHTHPRLVTHTINVKVSSGRKSEGLCLEIFEVGRMDKWTKRAPDLYLQGTPPVLLTSHTNQQKRTPVMVHINFSSLTSLLSTMMRLPGTYVLVTLTVVASVLLARLLRPDPLSRFPGPVLAKWTSLYRAYYDIIIGGGWVTHLRALHEAYGPIARVGPNELHFTNPTAHADIYNSSYRMLKDPAFYRNSFEYVSPNVFTVIDPTEHTAVRSLLSSYFSRTKILKLENVIQEQIDKLIGQLLKNHKSTPANMNHAFRSLSLDIITLYTFRTSLDSTSFPSFCHPAILAVEGTFANLWVFKHIPTLKRVAQSLPKWLAVLVAPSSKPILEMQEDIEKLVETALQDANKYEPDSNLDLNVFYTMVNKAQVQGDLKQSSRVTKEYLISEGVDLRAAGSETVSNTCTIGARYLVRDDRVRGKLVEELETAWPDKGNSMPLERLEKLPYLTAVIKESLRLSYGAVTPVHRVVPDSGAVIAGHPIPPGTIVSIASPFVHMNPDIFHDPAQFRPERWLEDKDHRLDRYLVSFGKGPRSCLGINLAWSELYLILGNVFRKLDFHSDSDLWSEVEFKDYLAPLWKGDLLSATVSERE
uniref:Benzoate 4-monooxygenase cytochrome p450 n=1 Tax=Moniliophthora roreri TaxID=221103 RepID=A0A0W0G8S8_MONRR